MVPLIVIICIFRQTHYLYVDDACYFSIQSAGVLTLCQKILSRNHSFTTKERNQEKNHNENT